MPSFVSAGQSYDEPEICRGSDFPPARGAR
jgi:hypothetical protein